MEEKKRDIIIDVLKGIAVLAVLLGHAIQRGLVINYENNIVFKVIYSFHMPLFMMLSGYSLYKYTKKYDVNFLKKRFFRLIIPTIIWSYLIYFVREFEFVGIKEFVPFPDSLLEYTKILFWHPDYIIWFLYIVFLSTIIIFIQRKVINEKYKKTSIFFTMLIIMVIYLIPKENFGIARLQIYFPIFAFGYYISMYFESVKKYLKWLTLPSIIIYLIVFPMYNVIIDNVIIFYIISTSAIIILYNLVELLKNNKINMILGYFGKKSLEIYLCQCVCLNIGLGRGLLRVITIFITATAISIILAEITNRFYITKMLLYGYIGKKGEDNVKFLFKRRTKENRI